MTFPSPEKYPKGRTEGETLSTGFLPRDPLFRDDTKGATPPLETPAYPLVEAPLRACGAGGESKEGAAAPSLVVAGGGS